MEEEADADTEPEAALDEVEAEPDVAAAELVADVAEPEPLALLELLDVPVGPHAAKIMALMVPTKPMQINLRIFFFKISPSIFLKL